MSESAIDRTSRALDLIPFIAANPGWTIANLAQKFETSPDQIIKDLEMLFMCGLPGYSHSELIDLEIESDYVAVRNPQNLSKPRKFTVTEVIALLLGLEAIDPMITNSSMRDRSENLKNVLREFIQGRTNLVSSEVQPPTKIETILMQAKELGKPVEIQYRSARTDLESVRKIYPQSFYRERDHFYLVAYCEKTREVRHFRSDRIASATIVEGGLDRAPVDDQTIALKEEVNLVQVSLSTRNRFFVEEHPSIVQEVTEAGDHIIVTFSIGDVQWLLKALLSLPNGVEILQPSTFRDAYLSKIDAILELYR